MEHYSSMEKIRGSTSDGSQETVCLQIQNGVICSVHCANMAHGTDLVLTSYCLGAKGGFFMMPFRQKAKYQTYEIDGGLAHESKVQASERLAGGLLRNILSHYEKRRASGEHVGCSFAYVPHKRNAPERCV